MEFTTTEKTIFIQIASYRDPELKNTIADCLAKAKNPARLRFGICWQNNKEDLHDDISNYLFDSRFRIIDIDHTFSRGACWARNLTQMLYQNEDFFLQIDSHTRFVKDWDEKILKIWYELNDEKAMLTAYPASFKPEQPESEWINGRPSTFSIFRLNENSYIPHVKPIPFPNGTPEKPYRVAHVAAGLMFARGKANREVLYDPNMYFFGEEPSLAIRYFTHGYNLYCPHETIAFHYYSREESPKNWNDRKDHQEMIKITNERFANLVGLKKTLNLQEYGLGAERTLQDFVQYSGIDFEKKVIHDDTVLGKELPCSNSPEGWEFKDIKFNKTVTWDSSKVIECDDITFYGMFLCDQNRFAVYRKDLSPEEYKACIEEGGNSNIAKYKMDAEYRSKNSDTLHYLMIWPFSKSKLWIGQVYLPLSTID